MSNLFDASPAEIREWDDDKIKEYIAEVGPRYVALMDEAEKIMEQARPLNDGLYVARGELVDRGIELPS
ncbi:hypothetical protein [Nocardia phage NC1]|jgi:hypothetical protein|nr:hypothetical protein [Nocardia phage NC1]QSL67761.1 hypothetical protein [Nocardia phage P69]